MAPTDDKTKNENAQQRLEKLLTTATCRGPFCGSGTIRKKSLAVPEIFIRDTDGNRVAGALEFPLSDSDVEKLKAHAERAGVGLPDRTVVNLDVRKTWQLRPNKLDIDDKIEGILKHALGDIEKKLGMSTQYKIDANLYKLLLYEPGCFFQKHRDNERLPGMFGTLCLELPSVYHGAELSVWSPLTPNEKKSFCFDKTKNPKMHYTAFYADCYHEVTELTQGHRVALIYHLTAQPLPVNGRYLEHLMPPQVPPQPAEEAIAVQIAQLMNAFHEETDQDYPFSDEDFSSVKTGFDKPHKFAIVLSHRYTPRGLADGGIHALKRSDRAVAELLRAASMYDKNGVPSSDASSVFDAALSLAVVWDHGECTPEMDGFKTVGPLISLFGNGSVALDLGQPVKGDRVADAADHYDGPPYVGGGYGDEFGDEDDYGYYDDGGLNHGGNHSLPIYEHELLFGSVAAKESFLQDNEVRTNVSVQDSPKEVEFLGNGMPYMGRTYTRAVILIWPKAHRHAVALQSEGGRAQAKKASKSGKRQRA